ncbi:MAG: hypothetical protein HOW73_40800 [Polyangiaceae bacterium]|nr:hypothetical protein [Polyangiaceae bacterium]
MRNESRKDWLVFAVALAAMGQSYSVESVQTVVHVRGGSVRLLTPWVTTGDDVCLQVNAYGGARIAIQSVAIEGPGIHETVPGEGPSWGTSIDDHGDDADTSEALCFELPSQAANGAAIPLTVDLAVVRAERRGSTFVNAPDSVRATLALPISSPLERGLRRVVALGGALAWLLAVLFGSHVFWMPLRTRRNQRASSTAGLTWLLAVGCGFLFTHYTASLAIIAAFGFAVGTNASLLLTTGLLAGVVVVGRKLSGPERTTFLQARLTPVRAHGGVGYRSAAPRSQHIPMETIARALVQQSFRVEHRGHTSNGLLLRIRPGFFTLSGESVVDLVVHDDPSGEDTEDADPTETLEASYNDTALLVRATKALAMRVGALRLDLTFCDQWFTYEIDGRTSTKDIVRAFRRAQRDRNALHDERERLLGLMNERAAALASRTHPSRRGNTAHRPR